MTDRRDDLLDFLDGTLPEDKQADLRAWLDESPEHYEQLARLSFLHNAIGEQLRNDQSTALFQLETLQSLPEQPAADPGLTKKKLANAAAYLLHHTFTPKRIAVIAAAAVLLGVVLTMVLIGNPDPDPLATDHPNDSIEPGPAGPALKNPVATLTATHNAQWAGGPASAGLGIGDELHPNQTLTLTAGFAEITTSQGAVAILEAPATIELTHNNNALRLHAGKLVGICETDSSKGFVVKTTQADIVDLGTRFGVVASRTGTTEVHVIEGIVEVAPASTTHATSAKPQRLIAGQALQAKGDADDFVVIETDAERFAAIMPTRIELPGTGQGLALKEPDPNWRVTAIDGQPLETPGTMTVRDAHDRYEGPPFLPNDPATSQWLIIDGRLGQSGTGPVTFTCQSRFEIPRGVDASAARLIVSFDADDSVTAVRINGQAVAVPENEFEDDSRDLHAMTIRRHMIAGQNTIEFDIMDRRSLGFANSGLRVKLALQPDEWRAER